MVVQAIETRYAGCHFRSRLEARWAVFFDHLKIKWEYEPQGYSLPSGPYLPDFFLPKINGGVFFEVKADTDEGHQDDLRWPQLAVSTMQDVFVAFGLPRPDSYDTLVYSEPNGSIEVYHPWQIDEGISCSWDNYQAFCICRDCGAIGIQFEGRSYRLNCPCDRTEQGDRGHNPDDPRILTAYEAARSARFEHGQSGA